MLKSISIAMATAIFASAFTGTAVARGGGGGEGGSARIKQEANKVKKRTASKKAYVPRQTDKRRRDGKSGCLYKLDPATAKVQCKP